VHFGEKLAASSFRFCERIAIAEIQGLKNVAVCNVHKEYIDKLHLMASANEWTPNVVI